MNKPLIVGLVGIVLVATLLLGVHAYGQQIQQNQNSNSIEQGTCEYHDQMQTIMTTGTYADLVKLREESGKPMMPFVTDETSFKTIQEHHKQMIAQYGDDFQQGMGCGAKTGAGMHQGQGLGKNQGHRCPMRDN